MEQFFYQCEKNGCFLEQYVYHIGSYHYNWHRELELMTVLCGYAADQSGISSSSFWYRRFGIPLETVREYAELKRLSGTVRKGDVKTVP